MSQIRIFDKAGQQVLFGLDHAIGFFLTVIAPPKDDDDDDNVVVDWCTSGPFANRNRSEIIAWIRKHCTMTKKLERQLDRMMLDLDPEEAA